jgi:hypothetical protein
METYLWMVIMLAINWGGFIYLLVRTSRKETSKTKSKK